MSNATSGNASKPWPADRIERLPIDKLVPYARNARKHSDAQVAQISASMREWGWTNPVLVDEEGGIIAGHGRVLAGRQLGLTEVPCLIARGWTDAQKRAYVLVDNQLPLNADWDEELLSIELKGLDAEGFDLKLLGFDDIDALLADKVGLTDPDDAPEPPAIPVSFPGDVWLLGRHRLLCGDATKAEDVEKCLGGVEPHLMVTDPPYGVNYRPAWRNESLGEGNRSTGTIANDDRADWREVWSLYHGEVAYVWHAGTKAGIVAESLIACGFDIRTQIIWAKQHFAISRGHYHVQHEPCWYAVRENGTGHWSGDRTQTTLWQINNGLSQGGPRKAEDRLTGHGSQKPVECMKRPIENNSSPGQAVYEPFSGSGTTIIAGEMTGRSIHAIEIMPAYVDVAVQRWQNFTGKHAKLEGDGRIFNEIATERKVKIDG